MNTTIDVSIWVLEALRSESLWGMNTGGDRDDSRDGRDSRDSRDNEVREAPPEDILSQEEGMQGGQGVWVDDREGEGRPTPAKGIPTEGNIATLMRTCEPRGAYNPAHNVSWEWVERGGRKGAMKSTKGKDAQGRKERLEGKDRLGAVTGDLYINIELVRMQRGDGFAIENRLDSTDKEGMLGRMGMDNMEVEILKGVRVWVRIKKVELEAVNTDVIRIMMSRVKVYEVVVIHGINLITKQGKGQSYAQEGGYHLDLIHMFYRKGVKDYALSDIKIHKLRIEGGVSMLHTDDEGLNVPEVGMSGLMLSEGLEYQDIVVWDEGLELVPATPYIGSYDVTMDIPKAIVKVVNVNWCNNLTIGSIQNPLLGYGQGDFLMSKRKKLTSETTKKYSAPTMSYKIWHTDNPHTEPELFATESLTPDAMLDEFTRRYGAV